MSSWLRALRPYWATFLSVQLLTRILLLFYSKADISAVQALKIFSSGLVYDLQACAFFMLPALLGQVLPKMGRYILFTTLAYAWLFGAVSEFFFWEEFGTRFNFIAVDYLVYTTEVIGNIKESYPLYPLLAAIGVASVGLKMFWRKALASEIEIHRSMAFAIIIVPFLTCAALPENIFAPDGNQSREELSKNGVYALFSAYRNNELDYKGFYKTEDDAKVAARLRQMLKADDAVFASGNPEDITRIVRRSGAELHKNVVMVVMESLSGAYTAMDNGKLTPNLNKFAREGLSFSDFYATGTRTVRGLEALSLSVPPTPGQSIVRRKDNGGLFTIGGVFDDRGYDTAFIYGGHGYFDNMNAYFAANGYRIVDRMEIPDEQVTFSNVWGICDEDLFAQAIRQADMNYAKNKPFFFTVMTTSNHRPYTFPEGKIDLPQGKRLSAVKYADFAVGELIKNASKKPWFSNTVFIFVSDHTAGAGGKTELNPEKYRIPATVYAPGFIKPQNYARTASQIDLLPTLLGLLNFSYTSKFFGDDLLNDPHRTPRAFISNYQKIGLLRDGKLTVLVPNRGAEQYVGDEKEEPETLRVFDTTAYYQFAADWRTRQKRVESRLGEKQ